MKNEITISFCIPTFNRAQNVYRLACDILLCSDPDIEVVILDNGSTDNTLDLLGTISDSRMHVYSNGENRGALYNMVHVLEKGQGNFLVYSTDKDQILYSEIKNFKSFLLNSPNIAGGYILSKCRNKTQIYPKGFAAVEKIAYKGFHPTGYFFKNDFLKSIRFVERFSDYNFVHLFPLEFAFAEICLMGDGVIYGEPLFEHETGRTVKELKSSTTNGSSKSAFFLPSAILKLLVNYAAHIMTLNIDSRERNALLVEVFSNEFIRATLGYKSVLSHADVCDHYYIQCRRVGLYELLKIGMVFYCNFFSLTKKSLNQNLISRICLKLRVLRSLSCRTISRISRIVFDKFR